MAKCKITISFLFLLFFATFTNFFCISPVFASTIYVGSSEVIKNIQDAITQANSGDTVFVHAGTYNENIYMRDGVNVIGESYARVTINGRVFFEDATCALKDITVLFPQDTLLSYNTSPYSDSWKLKSDAGITAINSNPTIQNCVIRPDLPAINPDLYYYGKAIQIWNMYGSLVATPHVEGNLIKDTDCGIYYFSQASGGAVNGEIKNNTFYHNKIGVLLRMHEENPVIKNNIFDGNNYAAIYYTYDETLNPPRLSQIGYNLFNNNLNNLFIDASQASLSLVDIQGNIGFYSPLSPESLYLIITDNMFYLSPDSPAKNMSDTGSHVGAYPADSDLPAITIDNPSANDKKFMGDQLTVSGTASDINGIWYVNVYVDVSAVTADINGTNFSATLSVSGRTLSYGINSITATAHDLAGRRTTTAPPRVIYLFRTPIAPPN